MPLYQTLIYAFLGGILPALVWLFYWLREDSKRPEPIGMILRTFVAGALTVPIAFVIQTVLNDFMIGGLDIEILFITHYSIALMVIVVWAAIEEVLKYLAAWKTGLHTKLNDEPVDAMIYLITAALGFSAFENFLFILHPILDGQIETAVITANLRFIGASLLHVASSGILGAVIAFSFYKKERMKKRYLLIGFVLATTLHTIFNSFIIRAEHFTLLGLIGVWISIIAIILIFERVKKIQGRSINN
jgi:RsiW-degrading membrane proteinase PrsW (M82 family)